MVLLVGVKSFFETAVVGKRCSNTSVGLCHFNCSLQLITLWTLCPWTFPIVFIGFANIGLTPMNTTLETPAIDTAVKPVDFGSGRYSPLMQESFKAAKTVFGFDDKQAEKLARQIGSDFGAAMRDTQATSKIGKSINGDGKVSLSEAAKCKTTCTDALLCMRAMQFAAEAGKFGFSYGKTEWTPTEEFAKILEKY